MYIMRSRAWTFCLLAPSFSATVAASAYETAIPSLEAIHPTGRNAFHIFNAIHSSMRQWGSSLNHNGMSFFPAVVPAGTAFYHGTSKSTPVGGMEWLAFEPEHAQQFAHSRMGPPPDHGNDPHPPRDFDQKPIMTKDGKEKDPPPWGPPFSNSSGYLHTYTAKRDLHLLYIDGMSAGKTSNGTLDSQDYILLNETAPHQGMWEGERANGLCNISRDDWGGRVDGFLRMEAGFEVILCHFERDLDVRSIARAYGECRNCETEETVGGPLKYLRAVADRYHGIGGGRVHINYDKMITAFQVDDDLFASGERGPRLTSVSDMNKKRVRTQIDAVITAGTSPFKDVGQDWQSIVDMIVIRYSDRLRFLTMPDILENEQRLNTELDGMLSLFIDYDNRDFLQEVSRCTSHYLPPHGRQASLAAQTVYYVSNHICHQLVSTQFGEVAESHAAKKAILTGLIERLDWTTWKQCGTCDYDEICSIPIWPFGSEEDWESPSCRNGTTIREQRGYWGEGGGPGGGKRRHGPPPFDRLRTDLR